MKQEIVDEFIERANLMVIEDETRSKDLLEQNPDGSVKIGMSAVGTREAADKVIELLRKYPEVDEFDFFITPVKELHATVDSILKSEHGFDNFELLCALGMRRGYHDILSMWDNYIVPNDYSVSFAQLVNSALG